MRIIFISDLHGQYALLPKLPAAELVIVGGDITHLGTPEQFSEALEKLDSIFPCWCGVPGNMDPPQAQEIMASKGRLLTLEQAASFEHIAIRGLGGGNKSPFDTPFEWEDKTAEEKINAITDLAADLYATHAPPFASGCDVISNGTNVGSKALAGIMEKCTPKLWLCGHIHEAAGIFAVKSTIVVNPGAFMNNGAFAEIFWNKEEAPSVWLNQI